MDTDIRFNPEQLQMIGMCEQILCDDNIRKYIEGRARNGYLTPVQYTEEGTVIFMAFDQLRYTGYSIDQLFEWNFLSTVKRMLTDWHEKRVYSYFPKVGRYINYQGNPTNVSIDLTRKQRGILTKILKIENKRKKVIEW